VIHLAAQAGVRYSIDHPFAYTRSNITGFLSILEACRHHNIPHLLYASSSSVYGLNTRQPFSVHHEVDHPVSLYATTKRANELMAHTYSHLYGLPTTGLRFFTVYGPWGRPDMAYYKFAQSILTGQEIEVYNQGDMYRDFTYIDDVIEGIVRLIPHAPIVVPEQDPSVVLGDPARSSAPFAIYNIGNSRPEKLLDFITHLENKLGKTAKKRYLPMQQGDVYATAADVSDLERVIGWKPFTPLEQGLDLFCRWFLWYDKRRGNQ
ncbi:MAG: NAD-dependent epimerase/dehydratase family protein, partial [Treponema sp.]|nr:NAD-dependent epimerase/dehydratase family protein [Treponema sp.]